MIHIYTGEGKGKTTTCIGLTVRASGAGKRVLFTQFCKNGNSSEVAVLKQIPNITYQCADKAFGFYSKMTEEQKIDAKKNYTTMLDAIIQQSSAYDMIVLDEIIFAYNMHLVDNETLLNFLRNIPSSLEVVLSGRSPSDELVALADYVSNVQKLKHPFDQGVQARKGIEY